MKNLLWIVIAFFAIRWMFNLIPRYEYIGYVYPYGVGSLVVGYARFDTEKQCEEWAETVAVKYGVAYSITWDFECNKSKI